MNLSHIDTFVSIAADSATLLIAIAACVLWLGGRNPFVIWLLRRARHRTIGKVLHSHGIDRRRVRRAINQRVAEISHGEHPTTVAGELRWLDESFSEDDDGRFTLDGSPRSEEDDELKVTSQLNQLAQGYQAMSLLLKSRGSLGGGNAPVVLEQAMLSDGTARRLSINANFARGRVSTDSHQNPPLIVMNRRRDAALSLTHLAMTSAPGVAISTVGVTHRFERCVAGELGRDIAESDGVRIIDLNLTEAEEKTLAGDPKKGRSFDGVLPSVRRIFEERDPTSGWVRLMLDVGETSYDAIRATHYPAPRGLGLPADRLQGEASVLTLSCMPVTSDGYMVLGRRSKYVINALHLTPGVNGNLEMRARFGLSPDNDEDHVPNPLRAIAREAREELALPINPDDMRVLGVTKFDCPEEVKITSLLTTCPVDMTADAVAVQSAKADVIEGRWELGDSLWFLPLEASPDDVSANLNYIRRVLGWTLTSKDHTPHLTSALIAIYAPQVGDHIRNRLKALFASPSEDLVCACFEAYLVALATGAAWPAPRELRELARSFEQKPGRWSEAFTAHQDHG